MATDEQRTASQIQLDRLAELDATALLDSPVEAIFDRFTRLASSILKTPISLVSLVDRDCRGYTLGAFCAIDTRPP
ncbi:MULTISPECIES: hypothetical protein [unclassified Chamaesiphon]|uniref:hypothetical protein n=1 Tax=unclassified Chamaesiphon TaxID=2620921 RepID=UPI00286D161E|nr:MULTISPECIES: hypothetical protein [unclassified Chamaesiphon]